MKTQKTIPEKELIEQITADQLDAIIANDNFTLIDVRDAEAIQSQGRIPGAINVPFEEVESVLENAPNNESPFFQDNQSYLFCCTGGVMSYMAALKAQEKGIRKVFNLEGGHSAWMKLKQNQNAA